MLNRWVGMGRIAAPLELRTTNSGISAMFFPIAIERDYKDKNTGERQTDFIDCVAYRQTAEFISRYFNKGSMICVEGTLNKRSYTDKSGQKRYVTDVLVDKVFFTGEPKKSVTNDFSGPVEGFEEIDDDFPFCKRRL